MEGTSLSASFGNMYTQLLTYLLVSLGYIGIFKKCGVKKRWAFVPIAREYQISLCADKEKEGRIYTVIYVFIYLITAVMKLLEGYSTEAVLFLFIPLVGLFVTMVIYSIKIHLGLIKVFNRKKRWIWMFIFFESLTILIWGYSKKFVPSKTVENLSDAKSAKGLERDMAAIDNGLTVNIRERTVIDFFRKKTLLKDVHMQIPKGHMVLLLGGSGAGKTTYLNALTGYEKADASIMLDKADVYKEYSKMKYNIGFVPQQDLMRGTDTVELTLSDAALLRLPTSMSIMERENRIAAVLDLFGLMAVKSSLVDKLSGGQRKRLSIALEFITDPDLFILDEPDSGLDGVVARKLFEKLRGIADEGKIVVVITHTPDRVIDLFDDVIVLAKDATRTGRLAYYGSVKESYEFFGKDSMEDILLSINQKDEGGEGRADEFVEKYAESMKEKVG
ncbi:ABC transporter ATP-binding protein [Butyrivibrio sp. VCB2006]|uniref:ABC transporter ATP-binding protein n=1 Tax=Butyrivibrio sp. VCB2006 TaxID=1280679 RepID=UPI000418E43D|nr:ABC transporter ATP-binding protein [Butyrivibrio sp. VCB2006]